MALRHVRAALFDMDGTILDIEPLSTMAINQQCAPAALLRLCREARADSRVALLRRVALHPPAASGPWAATWTWR